MTEEAKPPARARSKAWLWGPPLALLIYVLGLPLLNACVWKWDQDYRKAKGSHHWLAVLNEPMTRLSYRSMKVHHCIWNYQYRWTSLLGVRMQCLDITNWALN